MGFEKFENRWVITGTLRMDTPLRIGTPLAEYSTASAPVLLQYDASKDVYLPFIPGSSLKGVLRATAERIVNTHSSDKKIIEDIFGSPRPQSAAAQIKVRDGIGRQFIRTEERLHCATAWDKKDRNEYYKVLVRRPREPNPRPKTQLVDEENIPPTVIYDIKIDMDNASHEMVDLLLRSLDEFKYKRLQIGGGVSRGYGFGEFKLDKTSYTTLEGFEIKEQNVDAEEIKGTLRLEGKGNLNSNKFDVYYKADEKDSLDGNIVCEFDVKSETDFFMRGKEEKIVTSGGYAVIPGSVIKGFLRHLCYIKPDIKGRPSRLKGWMQPILKWDKSRVDDIFGSQNQRSRILISDAFSNKTPHDDKIPEGTRLKCWIVFDNMNESEIRTIVNILKKENQISGKSSAKGKNSRGPPVYNKVRFDLVDAWKYTLTDPAYDVTNKLR